MTNAPRSGFWFLAVGSTAALTHLAVFALTEHLLWPESANANGFAIDFLSASRAIGC